MPVSQKRFDALQDAAIEALLALDRSLTEGELWLKGKENLGDYLEAIRGVTYLLDEKKAEGLLLQLHAQMELLGVNPPAEDA